MEIIIRKTPGPAHLNASNLLQSKAQIIAGSDPGRPSPPIRPWQKDLKKLRHPPTKGGLVT